MMAQHGRLVALISLSLFGIVGILVALLWRNLTFRIRPGIFAAGVLMLLLGALLVGLQLGELAKFSAIESWPSVTGTVITSRVVGERAFRPNIVYQYEVASQSYIDSTDLDQPGFGGRNNKRNAAETIVSAYPSGTQVMVHYNPLHPDQSLLRVSPDWSIFGKIGLGAFMFGLGLFLSISYFVRRSQPNTLSIN